MNNILLLLILNYLFHTYFSKQKEKLIFGEKKILTIYGGMKDKKRGNIMLYMWKVLG
jgi:hypothetical protein